MKLTQEIIDKIQEAMLHTKKDGTVNWKDDDEIEVQLAGTFAADRFIVIKNKTKDPVVSALPHPFYDYEKKTMAMIEQSRSPVVMGHLELHGFKVNDYVVMEHGTNIDPFAKFDRVYSGHFHTRSSQNNIHYLGSPYEMYWNDWNDTRGFHLFDTETLEHTPVNNPYNIFEKVFYEDTPFQTFDTRGFEDKIVKVIVRKKSDIGQFERFIDKIYSANVAELKIVENFDFSGWYDTSETGYESEDTLSILNRYIDDSEVSLDKSIITKMVDEIYREACEVV